MASVISVSEALNKIREDGRTLGVLLADMLLRSSFSSEDKEAWSKLIPYMTVGELDQLFGILDRNLAGEIADASEDIMLQAKAAQMKHDFALTHEEQKALDGLDSIESELKQFESSGE